VILTSVRTPRSKFSWSMARRASSSHPLRPLLMLRVPIFIFGSLCFRVLGCVLSKGGVGVILFVALGSVVGSGVLVGGALVAVVMVLLFVCGGDGGIRNVDVESVPMNTGKCMS